MKSTKQSFTNSSPISTSAFQKHLSCPTREYLSRKEGQVLLSLFPCTSRKEKKIAIIGESGSGKRLYSISFMESWLRPVDGLHLLAKAYHARNHERCSYILQDSHYFDTLSLEDNILLGMPKKRERLNHILKTTGLEHLKNRTLSNESLSGAKTTTRNRSRSITTANSSWLMRLRPILT